MEFKYGSAIFSAGKQNINGQFNASINTEICNKKTNANLTICLNIHLTQINPTPGVNTHNDSDNNPVPIQTWGNNEWKNWKRKFFNECRDKWNGKFWLKTPNSFSGFDWPNKNPTHRCNLYCKIKIFNHPSKAGAHFVIPVVRVKGNNSFRSHSFLYSNRDLKAERLTSGSIFKTHYHEFGHLIGLDHPGNKKPGCITGGELVCYSNAHGNKKSIMGMGSQIYPRHAKPWKLAAAILTGTNEADWTATTKRFYPVRL